jgi:hypothetical protein
MAGTTNTLRVAGLPGGYPAEIDSTVKVRWVAPLLVNMSERSVNLLKYLGGVEQFSFNNTKIEWVEDDVWNRRPSVTGTPLAMGGTSFTVTGQAHRYPIGTIFFNVTQGEYIRVTAIVDADTLTVTRDLGGVLGSAPAWASTDEILVSGFSMQEDDVWTYRPSAIFSLPFNYAQAQHVAIQASFRRQETALYGLQGSDLDMQAANTVAEQFVAMEEAAFFGTRFAGSSSVPSMAGGIRFYVTGANGAQVTDLAGAAMTRKDIDDVLQNLYYAVGMERMARTLLVSGWGKRKISSFFSASERLGPGANYAGVAIDRFNTDFGEVDVLLHTAVPKNEVVFIRRENHKIGVHGTLGRPHLIQNVGPSSVGDGPRTRRAFYADWSMINSGPQAEGRIVKISTTA